MSKSCLALLTDAFGGHGGIAQYNRDLVQALAGMPEIGAIEILPRHAPGPLGDLPSRVRQHRPPPGRIAYVARAWRSARRSPPALVFCGHLHLAPLAAAIAWRCKARLVVQTHGVEAWSRPSRLQRWAIERADLVLAVSRHTRAKILDWSRLEPERVRVAPNTVADDYGPGGVEDVRRALGLDGKQVVLTVGRLAATERYKGQDRVISTLPALVSAGRDVVYLIAGDGEDSARLERLAAERGVADRVRFLGRVERDQLPGLYRAADVFVLASTGEGFGIVLLEAMACGAPALGLDVAGSVDALAEGALGQAVTPDHLAAALMEALGAAGRDPTLPERVRARFGRPAFEARLRRALSPVLGAQVAA